MNLTNALKVLLRSPEPAKTVGSGFSMFGGVTTKKGTQVTPKSALTLSAFYNGIEILTNDFGKLPKHVYQKTENGRIKIDHPVNYLLSKRPDKIRVAMTFDKMMVQYAILKGNAYAEIIRNGAGTPVELRLIDQEAYPVQVIQYNNSLFYRFNGRTLDAENIIHIPGFSYNGITGVSVITHAAHSLGVNLSSQEYASDYYQEKGMGYGVVTAATKMENDAKLRLGEALASVFNSSANWKVPIIDEASNFQHIKITPQESQFLATHKQGVEEVARWLNIPPHKLKTLDNVNNSITENQEIQHVTDSILPWAIKFEQEYSTKLFTPKEQALGIYVKANINALLRADVKSKAEYYSKAINFGWLTRNEVRALEEINPLDGLDQPLTPANTFTVEQMEQNLENGKNDK